MPHSTLPIVTPLPQSATTGIGAEVSNINLANISEEDFEVLRQALYQYQVIVINNVKNLEPAQQAKVNKLFDPTCLDVHGHGSKQTSSTATILSKNGGVRIPRAPQIQIIGNGVHDKGYEGIAEKFELKHVHHKEFHHTPLSEQEMEAGETRFYRWHIDSALYEYKVPHVTTLFAKTVPAGETQFITMPDGKIEVPLGATAFFSGEKCFEMLTPEEQEFAKTTSVRYAPRPYNWINEAKATSDGLSIVSEGKEIDQSKLPAWTEDNVKTLPLVWKNPVTGKPALQIHGCCVENLILANGERLPVEETRRICHKLQSRMMSKDLIYCHDWKADQFVIFHNRGVSHSITGNMGNTPRLMWQSNLTASSDPVRF